MTRYYELDATGKVNGSYAVPQPDMELTLLQDAPNDESMWDGMAWIADPDKVAAREAAEAKVQAVTDAKASIATIETAVDKAADVETLRKTVLDLTKAVKVLTA